MIMMNDIQGFADPTGQTESEFSDLSSTDLNLRRDNIQELFFKAESESNSEERDHRHRATFDKLNELAVPPEKRSTGKLPTDWIVQGFISNNYEIPKGYQGGKGQLNVVVDTDNLWEQFKGYCDKRREKVSSLGIEIAKAPGLTIEEQASIKSVQELLLNFFRPTNKDTYRRNSLAYAGDSPKLSSFGANSTAVCTEMAVFAHNLLSFEGMVTALVLGGTLSLWDSDDNLINGDGEPHVFILIKSQKGKIYLFDVVNHDTVEKDGIKYPFPYVREIEEEMFKALFKERKEVVFEEGTISRGYHI